MNKKIKGHELMKLIAENKIKEGQEFVLTIKNTLTKKRIYWSGKNLIYCDTGKFVFGDNADIYFLLGDLEILEDEEEIDIQAMEELTYKGEKIGLGTTEKIADEVDDCCPVLYNSLDMCGIKINELIKAVKQLDKKINKED